MPAYAAYDQGQSIYLARIACLKITGMMPVLAISHEGVHIIQAVFIAVQSGLPLIHGVLRHHSLLT